jgi:predicted SAM-dependent methyltransferase
MPIRLSVGAGGIVHSGWISVDQCDLDVTCRDSWERFLGTARANAILAEHVWEHLSPADALAGARNCLRFLEPGGHFRIAVPDGFHPDPAYRRAVEPGGTGEGADDHRVLYDCETLTALLQEAGFHVRLLEYFDRDGRFHFNEWDPAEGMVRRSSRFDRRNDSRPLTYTSLIADGVAPDDDADERS